MLNELKQQEKKKDCCKKNRQQLFLLIYHSRIERGDRNAKREQVLLHFHLLSIEKEEPLSLWIADKVNAIIDNENEVADKALRLITMSRYGNKY